MKSNIMSYPEFYEAIQNNELVYLFGAGISSSLTDNHSCSWWQWIVNGIEYMKDTGLAAAYKASIEKDGSTGNLVSIVGKVMSATRKDGTYAAWMKNSFETVSITNNVLAGTLKKLLLTQDVFATTNYDRLLECATGLSTLSYEEPDKAFCMLDQKKSEAVLHIHGVYDSVHGVDNIIADQEQYNRILDDKGAQFIQHILGTRTLIFVGCGQTTEDANVSRFIQFAETFLHMDRDYYFLYKKGEVPVDMPDNIKLIPYGDDYSDLPKFLEDMAQERLRAKIESNPIIGRTAQHSKSICTEVLLKYHYSQETIPFCGRKEELNQLQEFIAVSVPISWWVITGQAGAGKSRLALEMLKKLPVSWFGFFLNDKVSVNDIHAFIPFTNSVVIIDYVSGRERWIAEIMQKLKECFEGSSYYLRVLLIERENNRKTGSWYAKLVQHFGKYGDINALEYKKEFLNIVDLDEDSVTEFVGAVCSFHGLESDQERNATLRDAYKNKLERLNYRPLFVQIFVEAWIENDFSFPRYDNFEDILQILLSREQEKWLANLDGNQECCNAFIHLLLRANVSGELNTENLPDFYKDDWRIISTYINHHSFPGQQRKEERASIINAVCHNIDNENYSIIPLFPDIIKEYMFFYYMEDERLDEVMNEIWQHVPHDFSVFIARCLTDFPDNDFFRKALNVYNASTRDHEILVGRLSLLKARKLGESDDPNVLYGIVENEYEFWRAIVVPEESDPDFDKMSLIKISGLNYVAQAFGGWSMFDVSRMVEAAEEALEVPGGQISNLMKQFFLQQHITELSKANFIDEAAYLRRKMELLIAGSNDEDWESLLQMQNENNAMMERILQLDFYGAYEILKKMEAKCKLSYIEAVRVLAHSCFNYDNLACSFQKNKYVGRGARIAEKLEFLYPDDKNIRARTLGCNASKLQADYFSGAITAEKAVEQLECYEDKLNTMAFENNDADEALGMTWGMIKTFKINFIDEDKQEMCKLISETDEVLAVNPHVDEAVTTKITALHVLHKKILNDKVPHLEVEDVFRYVELNNVSGSIRNAFFEMLADSEDAEKRENYMTECVMYGARQDAKYNPLMGSGIEEIDDETDILRSLYGEQMQETVRRPHKKIGANDKCPCGSGKKFKKCCRGNGKYD